MTQQPRLDVIERQRLSQQWIVVEINLPDGQIVCRAPPGVNGAEFLGGKSGHYAQLSNPFLQFPLR